MNALINQAWKVRGLSVAQKCVLVRLADFAGKNGTCWPGHKLISDDCQLTERSVRTILPALASLGHITIQRQSIRGSKGAARFTYDVHPVTHATPEASSPVTPEKASPVTPEVDDRDTGSGFQRHRKLTTATPEIRASAIIGTIKNHHKNQQPPPLVLPQPVKQSVGKFRTESFNP